MALMRWDPFRELEDVSNRLNRLFARPNTNETGTEEKLLVPDWAPMVDITETPEEFLIKAELPEMKKEDVKVTVEGGVLSLEGERKQEKEEKGKKYHRIERSYGHFLRTFTLPDNVDEKGVRAEYKDGVLNVHLLKSAKAAPKTVEVKVG